MLKCHCSIELNLIQKILKHFSFSQFLKEFRKQYATLIIKYECISAYKPFPSLSSGFSWVIMVFHVAISECGFSRRKESLPEVSLAFAGRKQCLITMP